MSDNGSLESALAQAIDALNQYLLSIADSLAEALQQPDLASILHQRRKMV